MSADMLAVRLELKVLPQQWVAPPLFSVRSLTLTNASTCVWSEILPTYVYGGGTPPPTPLSTVDTVPPRSRRSTTVSASPNVNVKVLSWGTAPISHQSFHGAETMKYDIMILRWCDRDECILFEASAIAFASKTLNPNVHVKVLSWGTAPIPHHSFHGAETITK